MFIGEYETEEDRLGMSLQPGSVTIQKDSQNLIGISIGGGAPLCPCLYIVQVCRFLSFLFHFGEKDLANLTTS